MNVRLIKLSEDPPLSGKETIAIHLSHFITHSEVTFSTGIPISEKPDYILLMSDNHNPDYYWCHVKEYDFKKREIYFPSHLVNQIPERYRKEEEEVKNVTWLLFDSMTHIPSDLINMFLSSSSEIKNFINTARTNNQKIIFK